MTASNIRLSILQQHVVDFDEGALLVVAGPGSGKTRVLTERVRRLVTSTKGHFRVLALTFTNKAANEMAGRLKDLGDLGQRAFIGTLHGFCLDMLTDRGKPVGVTSSPQIFEQFQDRKQILLDAVLADPALAFELTQAGDAKARNKRIDDWLRLISFVKTHPISQPQISDETEARIFDAYNAGLRASGAFDFDDLLLLSYRLLTDYPKVADFYRRLFRYICIDEAQDLNEAQYALLQALCGGDFKNLMMVGDPKQSIYGFNTASPEFMEHFAADFNAVRIELTDNFRSSRVVVGIAKALEPTYVVEGQLPIQGQASLLAGTDEKDEARRVVDQIVRLLSDGHPDIEGPITPARCAVLGRTRFTLLAIEAELKHRELPYFKRLSSLHENESELVADFHLALRIVANPKDKLHLVALLKKWGQQVDVSGISSVEDVLRLLQSLSSGSDAQQVIIKALRLIAIDSQRINIVPSVEVLRRYADALDNEDKRAIYDDTQVILGEWDQYLRAGSGASRVIGGFLSNLALGTTQQINTDGIALLTVHSSKGLEFEVVFLVGMAEGVFPDYRATGKSKEMAEERRNAFVAVTRSKRLIFFSYPRTRLMPWGDVWNSRPSPYLASFSPFLTP
ncbi:MAG: UvrD/REP helicase [Bradyrhizobium sp.]|nr:UvrD/REP helicase [Bradyrhizobium sp.]